MNDMCGRFAFQGDQWPELTADIEQPVIEPNYNICPKDNSPVIHYDSDNLAITSMQWGFVLLGAKRVRWNHQCQNRNNRFKANVSRSISSTTLSCSCKWMVRMEDNPRGKVPFYHSAENKHVLLMAGFYELWGERELSLKTFTIITQESTPEIQHIHNRMPVIIDEMEADLWLKDSLQPSSSITIEVHPVAREVNKTTAQGPQLIRPIRTLFD